MSMFRHATVGTNDLEKARAFYDGVLGALGYSRTHDMPHASVACLRMPIDVLPCDDAGRTIAAVGSPVMA